MGIVPFAIGRVAAVGDVDEVFIRQLGPQGLQNTQTANTAVKYPNQDRPPTLAQTLVTGIFLNSPVAIFFCHSAGPVMWALVPPASTATVTGMSTTSNS